MNAPRTDLESQLTVISCEDSCIETYVYREGDLYSGDIVTADFARQLEAELQTMTALAERLAEALEACQEDSQELLAERSWWINEPRCGYAGRYLENKKRIAKAEKALADYESHKKQTP